MNRARRKRGWRMVAVAMAVAMAAVSSAHTATQQLSDLIGTVIRRGPDSVVPAHLSVVLGLSRIERATPVKQAVMRDRAMVRTFNVCTAKHDNVVFITYNEETKISKAYLVSPGGVLRKAVAYRAAAPATERPLDEAASDFAGEIKFWMDFQHLAGSK
ncbi:MAG: hypothetical protein ABJC66_00960 [Gammaproteobacteria bacterium]